MARLLPRLRFTPLLLSALLLCAPFSQATTNPTPDPTLSSPSSTIKAADTSTKKPVAKAKTTPKSAAKKTLTKASTKAPQKAPVVASTNHKSSAKTRQPKTSQQSAAKPTVAKSKTTQSTAAKSRVSAAQRSATLAAAKPAPVDPSQLDAYPKVAKAYLVKVDGQVLWEGEPERRLPPASLTKMMTALLVVESYRPNDVVEVSAAAAAETGSHIGLRAGDRLLLADVLAATMIRSANDACHALADWHSGSEAAFVVRMNQRAEQLGLRDTHFQNACGHDNPDHYSSAHDLSVIAETALKNPAFAHVVNKPRLAIRSVDGRRTFRFKSTNALIGHVDGVMGVKTGYTEGAGPCLVALAERDNVRVMLVLLNAHNRWPNATSMIDNAFAQIPRMAAKKMPPQQAANGPSPVSPGV